MIIGVPFEMVFRQCLRIWRKGLPDFFANWVDILVEASGPPGLIKAGRGNSRLIALVPTGRMPDSIWNDHNTARLSAAKDLIVKFLLRGGRKFSIVLAMGLHARGAGLLGKRGQHP